ncbi:DUF1566 domain-containing protein [Thiothrix nivea]|uniref:Lcl C-terminal domain-containing protein n=1 Tax=Thiothrix nivea (strain ATCC 35100 / DSM 5205 / JP2) TaxID=870187 RepID=A0A656HEX4_THINJ|nr:DUF1566 domain-containing protein [Thiothrix nivea]EIJ34026.1 protein of unknown function DUF1566 [Thiothrix nivea DSM 5205]
MKATRVGGMLLSGCLMSIQVLAELEYQGQGGWRTSDGQGGWAQNDMGENLFNIGIAACKQTCEDDNACKGIEYVSDPAGWQEAGMQVFNKCEIHHDAYAHCDSNAGGRGSDDDGCWVKKPKPNFPNGPDDVTPKTGGLNDTGIIKYGTTTASSRLQEDASSGRDRTLRDDSDGHAGFSFIKISSSGQVLAADVADWSCVKDNVTGLLWEKKTENGLHSKGWSYAWYEPDSSKNGGDSGDLGPAGNDCGLSDNCNTWEYVKAVNEEGLCGRNDWRLPTLEELNSIVNFGTRSPTIDLKYFPNTQKEFHWSSDTVPDARNNWRATAAGGTGFKDGWSGATPKRNISTDFKAVRLVSGQ